MNGSTEQYQPPQDLELEQAVLGAILKDPDKFPTVTAAVVSRECFYSPKHQRIYAAMEMLAGCREPIDIQTVAAEMRKRGTLDEVGGMVCLVELVERVSSTGGVGNWANRIAEKWKRRQLIATLGNAIEAAYGQDQTPEELVGGLTPDLVSLGVDHNSGGFAPVSDTIVSVMENMEAIQKGTRTMGVPTEFGPLNQLTGGFQKAEIIIVAGRPGMGKTSFMNCCASYQAARGLKVGFASAETAREEFCLRTMCTQARVDAMQLKQGKGTDQDWEKLVRVQGEITSWDYWVDDTDAIEINTLLARASQRKQEEGLDILYVDYLQRLKSAKRFDQKRSQIDYIVGALKGLAKSLGIPVVLASQISRGVEIRGGKSWQQKRPTMADLKESGGIEQDADLILGLFRPELYMTGEKKGELRYENLCECIIMKQRNGPTGTIKLHYEKTHTRFEDWNRHLTELPF